MNDSFEAFCRKLKDVVSHRQVSNDTASKFVMYCSQITDGGVLFDPYSANTEFFLKDVIPSVTDSLLDAPHLGGSQLDYAKNMLKSLNMLLLWAMNQNNVQLVNALKKISNPETPIHQNNFSYKITPLFRELTKDFFDSPRISTLSEVMSTKIDNFSDPMLYFSIIFQYVSYTDDETGEVAMLSFHVVYSILISKYSEEDIQKISVNTIVTIIKAIDRYFKTNFSLIDSLPEFMSLLSHLAKSDNLEKQLTALRILNGISLETDQVFVDAFNQWKENNDAVKAIINMDLHPLVLKSSENLISKTISDEDLVIFLIKSHNFHPRQREDAFRLIAQTMCQRLDSDTIISILTELEDRSEKIEFLCILTLTLFKSTNIDLYDACTEIIDAIFYVGESFREQMITSMELFFKELNKVDDQRNTTITKWRVTILLKYVDLFENVEFDDHICQFFADRLDDLRTVTLIQTPNVPFDDILNLLNNTIAKAVDHIGENKISQELINLLYILVVFRNLNSIIGPSDNIKVINIQSFEFFSHALSALMMCNTEEISEEAINLFSRFFTNYEYHSQSIIILHDLCIAHLDEKVSQMARLRVLALIYKTLRIAEDEFQLCDFIEDATRNYFDETVDKISLKINLPKNKNFNIYAKPSSSIGLLTARIAMRLKITQDKIIFRNQNGQEFNLLNECSTLEKDSLYVTIANNVTKATYESASFALWNYNFTSILLKMYDDFSSPSLTKIIRKLLSFLPSDSNIMNCSVDNYLKMINETESEPKFRYLLRCALHFKDERIEEISKKFEDIWQKIRKMPAKNFKAIFEFAKRVLNDTIGKNYAMFLGGRVWRTLALGIKSAYGAGTTLYEDILTRYINVNDEKLLRSVLKNCNEEKWVYLKRVCLSFHDKLALFKVCVSNIKKKKLKNKYIVKILAAIVKEIAGLSENTEILDSVADSVGFCNADQLEDVAIIITELLKSVSSESISKYFDILRELLKLAFTKGSLSAQKYILEFFKDNATELIQQSTSVLSEFFDDNFKVWNYDSDKHKKDENGFTGLRNLLSTCYMNSLFQILNQVPEFLVGLFKDDNAKIYNLQWIFASLQESTRDFIDPKQFIFSWKGGWNNDVVQINEQQDVNEFLQFLMNDCPIDASQIFKGTIENEFVSDNYQKKISEEFYSIPVEVKGFKKLQDSIKILAEPEMLNDYEIEGLGKIIVSRKMSITSNPKILVFQLHRFEFDMDRHERVKINDRFEFPENLNINNILKQRNNCFYTLHSIICHSGTGQRGHYYALIRKNKEWFKVSDKDITKLLDGYKEEAFGGRNYVLDEPNQIGNAYLLFYSLNDKSDQNQQIEIEIPQHLQTAVQKDNELFNRTQTVFSQYTIAFMKNNKNREANVPYLHNVLMHGPESFSKDFKEISEYINPDEEIKYTINKFDDFNEIFEENAPFELRNAFTDHFCKVAEQSSAYPIIVRIVEDISKDTKPKAIDPLLRIVCCHLQKNEAKKKAAQLLEKLLALCYHFIFNKENPNLSDILFSIASLLKSNEINKETIDLKFIENNYEVISKNPANADAFAKLVENAVSLNFMDIQFFFKLGNTRDDKIANVLNEENYREIGKNFPAKIYDIMKTVKSQWVSQRFQQFGASIFERGLTDDDSRPFFLYFLREKQYEEYITSGTLLAMVTSIKLDADFFRQLLQAGSFRKPDTYKYLLTLIKETENENEVRNLIRLAEYFTHVFEIEDFFTTVFENMKDEKSDEKIQGRFDAFIDATRDLLNEKYTNLCQLDLYKDVVCPRVLNSQKYQDLMKMVNKG